MLKRNNKAIAIAMVFFFCMSFFATGLVAPAQAAGASYSALTVPTVKAGDTGLGKVLISVNDVRALPAAGTANYEYLTISFPSGVTVDGDITATASNLAIVGGVAKKTSSNTVDLLIQQPSVIGDSNEGSILLDMTSGFTIKSVSGNIDATFAGPGIFAPAVVTIAKGVSTGSTTALAKSVKTIGDGGGALDSIIIAENIPGTLKGGDQIKLRLPSGFSWKTTVDNSVYVKGQWGFTGQANAPAGGNQFTFSASDREAVITLDNSNFIPSDNNTTAGRIVIGTTDAVGNGFYLGVSVNDAAKLGDIEVNVYGAASEQDILVATYGEYGVKVSENTVKNLVAGKDAQTIGTFYIEEVLPNSLVAGRTVVLELPAGAKWVTRNAAADKYPTVTADKGANILNAWQEVTGSKGRAIKATVSDLNRGQAAKLLLEKAQIYVEPGFEGDIEVTVSGSAGAEGAVKVAEVVKLINITTDNAADVVIGEMNQKAADILIVEGAAGAIMDGAYHKQIIIGLENGVSFAKKPTVSVEEGNLEIDSYKLVDGQLRIIVKYSSTKASKIRVSDVYLTLNRTVPEGPVKATLAKSEGNVEVSTAIGSTALDEGYENTSGVLVYSETSAGEAIIANTVTPAETNSRTATFRINSNIYEVNGVAKVMDAAPYIKNDRTYVPMRYVAETIGAEVVWDDAARTVTLTRGEDVVVFTIGSPSYTVNGETMTADVAPEISNSRTMLPARYVAEAFGAVVGWDPATSTVLIQK